MKIELPKATTAPILTSLGDATDSTLYGAKASQLASLLRAGFPVPEAVVLSAKVHADREGRAKNLARIADELAGFLKPDVEYMVRSSAIGEDGQSHSFAGQLDSFRAGGSVFSVMRAIEQCWASFHSERVAQYQKLHGVSLGGMSVLIQRMIEPVRAGVLFTCAPENEDAILVESVDGHCEKLVQGEVTPEREIYLRDEAIESRDSRELVEISLRIERHFGSPQDIEWARDASRLWIVQSRPITSFQRRLLWSNTNLNENYPDRCDPFLASIARESYYHYFKNLALRLRVIDDPRRSEKALRNAVGFWGDRMYYCMTSIHEIIAQSPLGTLLKQSFDDFVGHRQSHSEKKPRYDRKLIRFVGALVMSLARLPRSVGEFERLADRHIESSERSVSLTDLSRDFYRFLDIRFHEWYRASFADFFAMLFHGALGSLTKKLAPQSATHYQNALVQGIPNLISTQPILHMWEMRELIESDLVLLTRFVDDRAVAYSELSAPGFSLLKHKVDRYLAQWGFRCSKELMFLAENYSERPDSFLAILQSYVQTEQQDPAAIFSAEKRKYFEARRELVRLAWRERRFVWIPVIPILAGLARYAVSCRERVRLKQAHLYYRMKTTAQRLGLYFAERSVFKDPSDIFFLHFKEIDALLSESGMTSSRLAVQIQERRAEWEKSEVYPDQFYSYGLETKRIQEVIETGSVSADGKTLRGIAASRGRISGRAVVLGGVHEAARLQSGDILVTRQTDPGWICVFPVISGIVIERGGMLSHGAIVAREFGISAVVGVPEATKKISDESRILVDGDQGLVCLLDS